MLPSLDTPLTADELIELDDFLLSADEDEDDRLSVDEAHGYLTALVVSRLSIEEEDWLQTIWGEPRFADDEQKAYMTNMLQRMRREISAALSFSQPFEPLVVELEMDGEIIEAYEGWCFGFMLAVSSDENHWNQLPQNEQELLGAIAKLAILHTDDEADMDDEEYQALVELLSGSVKGLYHYWHQQK